MVFLIFFPLHLSSYFKIVNLLFFILFFFVFRAIMPRYRLDFVVTTYWNEIIFILGFVLIFVYWVAQT